MERLLRVGFQKFGDWRLSAEGQLECVLDRHAPHPHTLYAFTRDADVLYVGKTTRSLRTRMQGYARPSSTQSTNTRNHARIRALIDAGHVVEVFALPDQGLHQIGPFHLNLAAGLEDSIIAILNPPWNGGRKEETPPADVEEAEPAVTGEPIPSFDITLQPTYYRTGFFNIGVAEGARFGGDGQVIEIFLGAASEPLLCTINRTANTNATPRIMGGPRVRDWFQEHGSAGDVLQVMVLSPTSIRLHVIPAGRR